MFNVELSPCKYCVNTLSCHYPLQPSLLLILYKPMALSCAVILLALTTTIVNIFPQGFIMTANSPLNELLWRHVIRVDLWLVG